MNKEKIFSIAKDIKEIDDVLNNQFFDRIKAENIIKKHNITDKDVALLNSPLSPYSVKFENASDQVVANNLILIKFILSTKLQQEILNK